MSKNQNGQKPKCLKTQMPKNPDGQKPKWPNTKTAKNQNGQKPKWLNTKMAVGKMQYLRASRQQSTNQWVKSTSYPVDGSITAAYMNDGTLYAGT